MAVKMWTRLQLTLSRHFSTFGRSASHTRIVGSTRGGWFAFLKSVKGVRLRRGGESTSRDPRSSFQAVTARPLATRPSNYGWSGGTMSYGRNTGAFYSTREAGTGFQAYFGTHLDQKRRAGNLFISQQFSILKLRGAGSRFAPRRTNLMASDRFARRHRHCRQSEAESAAAGRSTSAISSRKSRKRCCARPARRRPKRCKGNRTARRSGRRHQANCSAEPAGRRSHGTSLIDSLAASEVHDNEAANRRVRLNSW